ncbi:MAG: TIGR00730 family Rossman fold protein [Desulfobacteraceae bacterium]|nr:TIGR00730 family Rossman fold protein [Desulfobacteraceae bacterium]
MKTICVFCGSSSGKNAHYSAAAKHLGKLFAERNLTLVYGGGNVGLMGEIANSVLAHGGKVIGVIPQFLVEKELVHEKLSEVRIVESMHERKAMMAGLADGFIALPGGFGTLEETVEVLTWIQLDLHAKPIGLLNVEKYFNFLYEFFKHMVAEEFLHPEYKDMILIKDNPTEMLDSLMTYTLPYVDKWGDFKMGLIKD